MAKGSSQAVAKVYRTLKKKGRKEGLKQYRPLLKIKPESAKRTKRNFVKYLA
jgi:hypothetical protein